ncbi:MAG: GTP 3',8-cyclase MoaA [Thermodesulfobacteriota bacterium]
MEAPLLDGKEMKDILPKVNYLRLSVTDRCNLRCFYCTYWQDWEKLAASEILRYEELLRLAGVAAQVGIRKIRVTGGEPLVRRGVVDFIKNLHEVPGIEEVCLTTNGVFLNDLAPALHDAGLRHLNVSLDTRRRDRYQRITGRDHLPEVLAGLSRAAALGFTPLKINCVVLQGLNDDELVELALLARDYPFQVRFIELMPTISRSRWKRHFFPLEEVRRRLAGLGPLEEVKVGSTAGPARIFRLPGFTGELGFISPISEHRCDRCNRLRLTAAGRLRPCLLNNREVEVKGPLRRGLSDAALFYLFHQAICLKGEGGVGAFPGPASCCHSMASIGG